MKKFYVILAALVGAYVLTACQSTSNSPTPTTSATSCTTLANGQQYCTNAANTCSGQAGLTYNGSTGQWYNSAGQVVACNTNGLTTGATGNCQEWDSVYPGANYVPMVDPTTGNLICYNAAAYGVSVPSTYSYSNPVYGSTCPYNQYNDANWVYDCSGGWAYTGPNYGYGSSGGGWCMAVGDGDGDDYGYGDGYFGVCGF